MELVGKVINILPLVTGQGRNGEWRKQEFVIEIADGQFPKKVCFSLWGDKIDQAGLTPNIPVKVLFDIESREYNGRWFTEARAWRVEKQMEQQQASNMPIPPALEENPFNAAPSEMDDLPF